MRRSCSTPRGDTGYHLRLAGIELSSQLNPAMKSTATFGLIRPRNRFFNLTYLFISLMVNLTFAPRLQGKADLMEGRLLKSLQNKLDMIAGMTIDSLLRDSHFIRVPSEYDKLWVTRISPEYRLIFRRTGTDSIEAIDVVSHEDLNKFIGSRP
jgi:plasmid maintenance system killer protein